MCVLSVTELVNHPAIQVLARQLDLQNTFGFIKLVAFPSADIPGLSAAEITTGMPQGSANTPSRFIVNASGVANVVVDDRSSANVPDDRRGLTAATDVNTTSIPQVVSFDDVSSIVLDKPNAAETQR